MSDDRNTVEETVEVESSDVTAEEKSAEAETADKSKTEEAQAQAHANEIDDSDLANYVEAMIFSSASPLPSTKISQSLNCGGVGRIKNAIAALNESYEITGRSFRIRQVAGGYQYYVLPQWTDCLKKLFTKTRKIRLTKAALETMAVVAYKQPVSKNQIEFVRGVASDGVLHNLLEKNLVRISGRSEGAGRSLLYSATEDFLKFFGLNSFDDLPRIAEIEELIQQMEVDRVENLERNANNSDEAVEADASEIDSLADDEVAESDDIVSDDIVSDDNVSDGDSEEVSEDDAEVSIVESSDLDVEQEEAEIEEAKDESIEDEAVEDESVEEPIGSTQS